MGTLEDLRKEIDEIDQTITKLLLKRIQLTGRIGDLKAEQGMPVLQSNREQAVLELAAALVPEDDPAAKEAVMEIFQTIMAQSRKAQVQKIKDRRKQ